MAPGLLDRTVFTRLADEHMRAWADLAATAVTVASLPVRTVATLAGLPAAPEPPAAPPAPDMAEAHRRRAEELAARLTHAEGVIRALREDYAALEHMLEKRITMALEDQKLAFYRQIEPLLTQLPVARKAVAEGREMDAADLLALLGPLDTALSGWGLEAIGEVGDEAPFDPVLHQATGRAPEAGQAVRIKHVGYRLGDRILRRAKVAVAK